MSMELPEDFLALFEEDLEKTSSWLPRVCA